MERDAVAAADAAKSNAATKAEADKNFLQIIEMKKQGIDPFRSKNAEFGDANPDDDVSTSESSYVSTSDSDERRERKYRERMAKTKAKLDWDIKNLREKDAKINIQVRGPTLGSNTWVQHLGPTLEGHTWGKYGLSDPALPAPPAARVTVPPHPTSPPYHLTILTPHHLPVSPPPPPHPIEGEGHVRPPLPADGQQRPIRRLSDDD